MPLWLQNLLVLSAVLVSIGFVLRQMLRTLRAQNSAFGCCCGHRCPATRRGTPSNRTVIVPVESLLRRR